MIQRNTKVYLIIKVKLMMWVGVYSNLMIKWFLIIVNSLKLVKMGKGLKDMILRINAMLIIFFCSLFCRFKIKRKTKWLDK